MRKTLVGLAVLASVAAACSNSSTTASPAATGSATQTAQQCAASAMLTTDGKLTVGTDSPAYAPYFQGGTEKGSQWDINDPNTGKGFESAVAYEIANRMGFARGKVTWVVVPFTQSYAPQKTAGCGTVQQHVGDKSDECRDCCESDTNNG